MSNVPLQLPQLYADLSQYYDRFCRDIDYPQQCAYAQRLLHTFGSSGGRDYFDLACGTGQHLRLMADAGFTVAGLDNSQAMLDQAAIRCPEAALICEDMAQLTALNQFDLISCFLYSLHYSQSLQQLENTLARAWRALKPGGVLVFDVVDKNGIDNIAGVTTRLRENDQYFEFSSRWQYSGEGEFMQLLLSIKCQSATQSHYWQDSHTMTAISIRPLLARLEMLSFEVWVLERDFSKFIDWNGKSFNVVMVAVKREK